MKIELTIELSNDQLNNYICCDYLPNADFTQAHTQRRNFVLATKWPANFVLPFCHYEA